MVTRLISAKTSEIAAFTKKDLVQSIKASEGRVILSENVVLTEPVIPDITISEMAKSFGADLILLNLFDVFNPKIKGLEDVNVQPEHLISFLKKLVGVPVGLNLEPVDEHATLLEDQTFISNGRKATKETIKKANEMGFDFLCLTGNPGTGVSNQAILNTIEVAKTHFDGMLIAGKMHGAGVAEKVVDPTIVSSFVKKGIDVLLVPAVGTVPGITSEEIKQAVDIAHQNDVLVMSTIGTSQEGSDPQVIRQIALENKILGVDIQHIGDANMGLVGLRNITVLSDAIRGSRHTVSRIARSILR